MSNIYKIKVDNFCSGSFPLAKDFEIQVEISEEGCEVLLYEPLNAIFGDAPSPIDVGLVQNLKLAQAIELALWASNEPKVLDAWKADDQDSMRERLSVQVAGI